MKLCLWFVSRLSEMFSIKFHDRTHYMTANWRSCRGCSLTAKDCKKFKPGARFLCFLVWLSLSIMSKNLFLFQIIFSGRRFHKCFVKKGGYAKFHFQKKWLQMDLKKAWTWQGTIPQEFGREKNGHEFNQSFFCWQTVISFRCICNFACARTSFCRFYHDRQIHNRTPDFCSKRAPTEKI